VGGSAISELDRPPLVNLWVLDKKTMRLTNYYRKYDEDVLKKSIKFSSVAEFAEEADTSQEPVRILNPEALSSMGQNLQYFVQCVHQLKDDQKRRLVTLRNTDEPRYGNVMGWMNELSKRTKSRYNKIRESRKKEEKEEIEEIKVTVLKHGEVARIQKLERQNRKPTWAKIEKKRKLSIQLS
jgi:hypothetical protein